MDLQGGVSASPVSLAGALAEHFAEFTDRKASHSFDKCATIVKEATSSAKRAARQESIAEPRSTQVLTAKSRSSEMIGSKYNGELASVALELGEPAGDDVVRFGSIRQGLRQLCIVKTMN